MQGEQVLRQIQSSEVIKHIPVVIVSADTTAKQIEKLLSQIARHYLTKPLEIDDENAGNPVSAR